MLRRFLIPASGVVPGGKCAKTCGRHSGTWRWRHDSRSWRAVKLLNDGYGNRILLDVLASRVKYGHPDADLASDFVRRTAPGRATVCAIMKDSTYAESRYVLPCLQALQAHSVLLVTSDYHTHRSFSIFRNRLPGYQWSIAAAPDAQYFGIRWWTNREWAKTTLQEWLRLIWWNSIDRWR